MVNNESVVPPILSSTSLHYTAPTRYVTSICPLRYSGSDSYTGGVIIIVAIHRHKQLQCCCCCVSAAVDCLYAIRR